MRQTWGKPGVLIVPLRGTIRETVIINPMFAAVAAPKHGALSNNASSTHHTHCAVAIFPFNLVESSPSKVEGKATGRRAQLGNHEVLATEREPEGQA